jgi:hypothetical protein
LREAYPGFCPRQSYRYLSEDIKTEIILLNNRL